MDGGGPPYRAKFTLCPLRPLTEPVLPEDGMHMYSAYSIVRRIDVWISKHGTNPTGVEAIVFFAKVVG